jgi:hypothetical protein
VQGFCAPQARPTPSIASAAPAKPPPSRRSASRRESPSARSFARVSKSKGGWPGGQELRPLGRRLPLPQLALPVSASVRRRNRLSIVFSFPRSSKSQPLLRGKRLHGPPSRQPTSQSCSLGPPPRPLRRAGACRSFGPASSRGRALGVARARRSGLGWGRSAALVLPSLRLLCRWAC